MKWTTSIVLCVSLFSSTLGAAENVEKKGHGKLWWASVAAMVAVSVLDTHSSWGRQELNPVLANGNGRFGGKAIAIKAALAGGIAGGQYLLLRNNHEAEKYTAIGNFALAGVMGGVAARNYTNQHGLGAAPPAQSPPNYLLAAPANR